MLSLYSLGGQGNIRVLFYRKTTFFDSSSMIWNFCEELCSHDASLRLCIDYRAHNNTQNQKGARYHYPKGTLEKCCTNGTERLFSRQDLELWLTCLVGVGRSPCDSLSVGG